MRERERERESEEGGKSGRKTKVCTTFTVVQVYSVCPCRVASSTPPLSFIYLINNGVSLFSVNCEPLDIYLLSS
jgi:hypothetical protein